MVVKREGVGAYRDVGVFKTTYGRVFMDDENALGF
jgi:hypothetical protein